MEHKKLNSGISTRYWIPILDSLFSIRYARAKPGFTLIETFVAIVILTTALAGALSLASTGFNSADVAGDQIAAAFLAQDAIEYVRFTINTARLQGIGWLSRLDPCVSSETDGSQNYCYFDSADRSPGSPQSCAGGTCNAMYFDPSTGFYNYDGAIANNTDSSNKKFTRTVSITTLSIPTRSGDPSEARVTVRVSWIQRNGRPTSAPVVLQEDIYNWQ